MVELLINYYRRSKNTQLGKIKARKTSHMTSNHSRTLILRAGSRNSPIRVRIKTWTIMNTRIRKSKIKNCLYHQFLIRMMMLQIISKRQQLKTWSRCKLSSQWLNSK